MRRHSAWTAIHATVVLLLVVAVVGGCGGGGGTGFAPAPQQRAPGLDLSQALSQLDALATPPGVNEAMFAELKAGLRQALIDSGVRRFVSTAPDSTKSKVTDLQVTGTGTNVTFTWSYRNQGDYNQNGLVEIADLQPIGAHFNKGTASPDWNVARVADGDENGLVNLSDIQPIGANFLRKLDGYQVQYSTAPDPGGTWTQSATAQLGTNSSVPGGGGRRTFSFPFTSAQNGYYRVVPFDGTDLGVASDPVQYSGAVTNQPPSAALGADTTSGAAPLTVNFDASASVDPDGTIAKYEFDFGEGGGWQDFGTDATVSHNYTTAGDFTAKVRVTDNLGATDTASQAIHVTPLTSVLALVESPMPSGSGTAADPYIVAGPVSYRLELTDPTAGNAHIENNANTVWTATPVAAATITTAADHATLSVPGSTTGDFHVSATYNGNPSSPTALYFRIPTGSNLFDQALQGVGLQRSDLNLGSFPAQIAFTGFTNYGNDVTQFDNGSGLQPVPGSRFGAYTNYWHDDHTALPTWSKGFTDAVASSTGFEDLVTAANNRFFEGASRQTYWGNPNPGTEYTPQLTDPLANAVIDLINNHGGTADDTAIKNDALDVPAELQNALARILMAADAAATARDTYLTTFLGAYDPGTPPDSNVWHIAYNRAYAFRLPVDNNYILPFTLFGLSTPDSGTTWVATNKPYACVFNYLVFAQAMVDLAHALDDGNVVLSGVVPGTFSFNQSTPIGQIVINGGDGPTTYAAGDYVLICDCDGSDTYNCSAGANSSILNPVSICLDLTGNDTYNAIDDYTDGVNTDYASQQGTGRWGVGILVDYAGDDQYHASLASQGSGIFGWGLLYDKSGNDTYFGVDHAQGSGLCGVGILYDGGGQDSYHCWHGAQGFGDIWGLGILCDQGSDPDDYYAEWDATVGPAVFASAQNSAINASFAQGAAFGLRTTYKPDTTILYPVVWDGGVGALIDGGGDDHYTCGVFGQGVGFWFCTGVLDDRGGNDQYEGDWYVQAATAHYACSILMDRGGDDKYNKNYATRGFPLQNVTLGGAHDHSVSWLLDGGGNDEYYVTGLSLGTGNVNGWGYFIDMGSGTDTYSPIDAGYNTNTLGRGHLSGEVPDGDAREQEKTFGLFIDCGGADTYAATYATIPSGSIGDVHAGNNLGWFRYGYTNDYASDFRSNEFGAGLDGAGTTGFEF